MCADLRVHQTARGKRSTTTVAPPPPMEKSPKLTVHTAEQKTVSVGLKNRSSRPHTSKPNNSERTNTERSPHLGTNVVIFASFLQLKFPWSLAVSARLAAISRRHDCSGLRIKQIKWRYPVRFSPKIFHSIMSLLYLLLFVCFQRKYQRIL